MSRASSTSVLRANRPGLEPGHQVFESDSGAAAQRRAELQNNEDSPVSSPHTVIRGESLTTVPENNPQAPDLSLESDFSEPFDGDTETLQVRTSRRGSVRVNLSVPFETDEVLVGLSEKTGASKASFVMHALQMYLPELRKRLAEHNEVTRRVHGKPVTQAREMSFSDNLGASMTRAQRRKLDRDQKKAASRGGGRG
jgi:hypothetical protein